MNRYAPELALVTGGLLAVVLGAFVLFSLGDVYSAVVAAAVAGYPFVAYATHTSEDPTGVLPPRVVVAVGALAAGVVFFDVVESFPAGTRTLLFGWLLALCVFLPVAAYGARYGSLPTVLPARPVAAVTTLAAAGTVAFGASAAPLYATASSLLVFVAGVTFANARGGVDRRRRRQLPLAGLLTASVLVVVGTLLGGPLEPWVLGALVAAFGPLVVYGLTAELA
jgi:hypothetical protein